jgi:hypothetical protein
MLTAYPKSSRFQGILCLLLVLIMAATAWDAQSLRHGVSLVGEPGMHMTALYVTAGTVYLALVWRMLASGSAPRVWMWLLAGALMRGAMLLINPDGNSDLYRYLWDGALAARGINPFTYAPDQVIAAMSGDGVVPASIVELARSSGTVIHRINHPYLTTIYPPVAQGVFALAHSLAPWDLLVWRLVLLPFDLVTLLLVTAILRKVGRPASWGAVYWLNPLLVAEVFNAGHMDAIVLPFVAGAILASLHRRWVLTSLLVALAAASKVWPILLLPVLLRPLWGEWRRLALATGAFALLSAALWWPVLQTGLGPDSGFLLYAKAWQNNDSLFGVLAALCERLLAAAHLGWLSGQLLARVLTAALLAAWVGWLVRRPARSGGEVCDRCLWAAAGMFLLSPTQFPWYFTWLVPLLALRPALPLLLFTATLSLSYLADWAASREQTVWLVPLLPWVQSVPVWCGLLAGVIRARRPVQRSIEVMGVEHA